MGKTTTTTTPTYYGGSVSVNGQNKASSYLNNGTVYSNYNMSDMEKKIYDYAQNELLSNLGNINTFSNDTIQNMNKQINAYTSKGQDIINNTYKPMINNLKSDIASRFGNFDNSSFLNKLSSIESNRSDSVNSLAQDVLAKQNELVNGELSNRYNYLNFMNDLQNQSTNNILSYLNATNQNSNSGNNYTKLANSGTNPYMNLASSLLSNSGQIYSVINSLL